MAVNVGQRNVPDTPANRLTLNSANIKHERKKLQRLVNLAKAGKITKAKADECFHSWCTNAEKGNSYKLLKRMRDYYDSLWR